MLDQRHSIEKVHSLHQMSEHWAVAMGLRNVIWLELDFCWFLILRYHSS